MKNKKLKKVSKEKEVVCLNCNKSYYNTTKIYTTKKTANSAMLTLKKKYKTWGWESVTPNEKSSYGCLDCPGCGASLATQGYLRVQ